MPDSTVRYICYPRTKAPPAFISHIVDIFRQHEPLIGTAHLDKGLTSDQVLTIMRDDLVGIGFSVERGKRRGEKIERPVFFGEDGEPALLYEVDAYYPEWHCGLEVEAGRAVMGNAIYRDLVQALVMIQVDVLVLAVPNQYKYQSSGRLTISRDYEKTRSIAKTLYSHSRFEFPYDLILLGY